ncbi:MAG TPA: alpha/beta hydrolase [Cyanobacteria bacterium UBA11149]|nr:alpha/beta hydrolase [Cyanobacteria bacterium UBA11367]HBE57825.1 alpha/beta hydrolase [Cyanobacteria bacterium UBA11366]HBK66092.1 alpha/beta hydrolase [Cyanobacteria bacterium UBA11166]HBR73507.1 alpha/beta hydrolase [Cyanobacteria bacterium UBA11159]HBS68957.1 alpha/beta hydrolase [Cyanobacteria bacterium UBA11153]HBW91463.1 alpha/beta hydrolase [Cyanobacteria bacterium UBA11149]HCA96825.1 alpha/beta hydrolase [Cyanobacteria bacterium UBA9226]
MTQLTKQNSPESGTEQVYNTTSYTVNKFVWKWQNQPVNAVYETGGEGKPVLLLPAFSTVSSRSEMKGIASLLAPQFQVTALDWIGFGESDRLPLDYRPEIYHQFLQDFVRSVFNTPVTIIAAGHAAGYAMQLAVSQPGVFAKIILVAPTWRGPLSAMGASQKFSAMVRDVVRSPLLGQLLYKLNTAPAFLKFMYRRHVYHNPASLTKDFIQQKYQITQKPGARFAPAAFVTGNLDPVRIREDFLCWFQPLPAPFMIVISEEAPPKSKAEMEALAKLPGVQVQRVSGSLGVHEEYPVATTAAIESFLRDI